MTHCAEGEFLASLRWTSSSVWLSAVLRLPSDNGRRNLVVCDRDPVSIDDLVNTTAEYHELPYSCYTV
ncbi:Uncharacterized protein HZ326_25620 [Fusarium oxysporum f. sp. albedinis]|nr:Uncharacterized protein HZ326_25620 [Fusarium oxysporum f. sp. albedinis]